MSTALHIYDRLVTRDAKDSLSLIGEQIQAGSTILDLGMGAGSLGKYLKSLFDCTLDGVSHNEDEVVAAQPWYRNAVVADLDHVDVATLFEAHSYDYIVCADVLEHLRAPQHLLASCRTLLKPGGKLLTSIPNAGYCGLIAELIAGDFRYRPEGLLDETHLRFYTRKSLKRFFDANLWQCVSTHTVQRSLPASEFKVAFDALPPAVTRYLLALPDALSYQFISALEPRFVESPLNSSTDDDSHSTDSPAQALFSAAVYLAQNGQYSESTKVVEYGVIGATSQNLKFAIPASSEPYTAIRLDPADRAGFLRLYFLRIVLPNGSNAWVWRSDSTNAGLEFPSQQQIFPIQPGDSSVGSLLLLLGDDPWFELPLDPEVLTQISALGAYLEVGAGWPMSADYLEATNSVKDLHMQYAEASRQQQLEAHQHQLESQQYQLDVSRLTQNQGQLEGERKRLQFAVRDLTESQRSLQELSQTLMGELREAQSSTQDLKEQLGFAEKSLHDLQDTTFQFIKSWPFVRSTRRLLQDCNAQHLGPMNHLQPQPAPATPLPTTPVDIVVPVYRGFADTKRCIESVLLSTNKTAWRLIIVNDQSPEPELVSWLHALCKADSKLVLLENPVNLGFVGSVNRGMAFSKQSDILLLNSDTEVANNWLDRLQQAAYSRARVASVTPFSNNATICSYPRFCQNNEIPEGYDTARLDNLFARTLAGQTVEIPTAVGFCMYIRRECLGHIGVFDYDSFGKGYGEENDFCMRAIHAGWINLHALDTFVWHSGGISFGDSKAGREALAMETMRRLHPSYERRVHDFVRVDPAGQARLNIDIARITDSGRPVVLNVSHNREGGTLKHIRELTAELGTQATFLYLTPIDGGAQLTFENVQEAFSLRFSIPNDTPQLIKILKLLRVGHIHFHHLLGHKAEIAQLPSLLGVSHDFTAHDYYSYCPQITLTDHTDRYCGELGIEQCRQCVKRSPAPEGEEIDSWRSRHSHILSRARYLITPSEDVAVRMHRFVPAARIRLAPHATVDKHAVAHPTPKPGALRPTDRLKVVVIGALSKVKGADLLEEVASLAARQANLVDFHLVGYAYRNLTTQPKARLTVHGSYDESDLPSLLHWLQPDLIWFPAQCPETYSYTLSAALEGGYPVAAPALGAFSERLSGRAWSWLCNWNMSATQWLEFFDGVREKNFIAGQEPAKAEGNSSPISFPMLDYRSDYLSKLPAAQALTSEQMQELHLLISLNVQSSNFLQSQQSEVKSKALRLLIILRASSIFSPVAKLIPTGFQRRVKSWLVG